ncbi:T9SS type A sorting domain-containing protein [Flavobacterium silvaticum]|uniref:T9SS type A sorting domain-containing protein n=1 Tax=Flavobacterium silvaticum TaxID=1852020 RepID=A0A972FU19_9FLAO|nr:T9SS type A sorting domain-containing protein [Flavobacterium silvaticum]NMH29314.1 T9SS type A sorting domain-containing protein [Flavobacterium silvaticum]
MKQKLLILLFLAFIGVSQAQNVGDTIHVQTFNHNSTSRDTLVHFPDTPGLTFEKILLKYNLRCKNGTILNGSDDGVTGCGEWDYSCNTFIADSAKVEKVSANWPDYQISNFTGTSFPYTTQQTYDHYDFAQQQVTINSTTSETSNTVGSGSEAMTSLFRTSLRSGRSHLLFTAAQLTAAGFSAGEIDGLGLNVTNAGGLAKFLRVSIKTTALTSLPAQSVGFTGFTEVFFSNYTFVPGANRIQFHTPYNWDGTSNIIVEFSFSNDTTAPDIQVSGFSNSELRSLSASNIASIETSAGDVDINTQFFNTISNELSVTFWAYGDPVTQPTDCSIVYGYSDDVNQRELNLHLPWAGQIYFDCGYVDGGFDRIEKPYGLDSNIKGQWNHWAFVKNATTGSMKVYLNGAVWNTGTEKTRAIQLLKFYLGKMIDGGVDRNFKGKIRELTVWDKEISAANILAWKNKSIDATHPDYANLVAYYKLDELSGQTVSDSKHSITSPANNISWGFERGDQLTTTFTESTLLPNLTFYRGVYDQTNTPVTERYSYPRAARSVRHYSVTSNEGVVPMMDDTLNLLSTQYLFDASPENVYNGLTGEVTSTLPVTAEGTITVTSLAYFKRYPFYNELVSFVTPYGIGLDLGPDGKSWFFDMSDYVRLLKGNKRIIISMGGERQEEMDLEFLFIVGTPPRNVVQYEQLWQGGYRMGGIPIADINSGTKLPTNNFAFSSEAASFKLKSSITGHGQQGEFSQSGGVISHRIRANNTQVLSWTITQDCSENPIFPQGGTWVYNRQGWCPGQRSLLKEQDITSFATPGTTVALDYRTSNPSVSSGDYRYIVAHQVIGYGAPNFTTDASLETVKAPNNVNAEYSRINPMCEQPRILLRNTGASAITTVNFEYWLNESTEHQTYTWNGTLASMNATDVVLPTQQLWDSGVAASSNKFHVQILTVNNAADGYSNNNSFTSSFSLPDVLPTTFKIRLKTNSAPTQNSYTLYDDAGNVVDSKTFTVANTVNTYTYTAPQITPGCYHLRVEDTGNNGLSWWADTSQGTGYMRLLDENNAIIKTFNPDFGGGFDYSFSVNSLLSTGTLVADHSIRLYPNPSKGQFRVEGDNLIDSRITLVDMLGKVIREKMADDTIVTFDEGQLNAGMYLVKIEKDGNTETKKLVIQ